MPGEGDLTAHGQAATDGPPGKRGGERGGPLTPADAPSLSAAAACTCRCTSVWATGELQGLRQPVEHQADGADGGGGERVGPVRYAR